MPVAAFAGEAQPNGTAAARQATAATVIVLIAATPGYRPAARTTCPLGGRPSPFRASQFRFPPVDIRSGRTQSTTGSGSGGHSQFEVAERRRPRRRGGGGA